MILSMSGFLKSWVKLLLGYVILVLIMFSILHALSSARVPARLKCPLRLAIYYGFPSLVNSAADTSNAAQIFSRYDVVVLGDGLEFGDIGSHRQPPGPGPEEHRKSRDLVSLLRRSNKAPAVYGYITLGNSQKLPVPEIARRAALWAEMGVEGIFLDEAGYDFGNTRSRQNDAIRAIHALGLGALMNAYRPEDLFSPERKPLNPAGGGNPQGQPTLLGKRDIFLLESFQIREGQYEDGRSWYERTARAVKYRDESGARLFAITTCLKGQPFSHSKFLYAWWSAVLWGLDGFGWGEPAFSSQDSLLPWHDAPALALGTRFLSSVALKKTTCSRRTDNGTITVDTAAHTATFIADSDQAGM